MPGANDIEVLEKRLAESRLYDMNFSPNMDDAETISTIIDVTATATSGSPTPLTIASEVISGKRVQFRLSGGSAGAKYLIVVQVTTSLGNTLQGEGYLVVREPG